MKKAVLISCFDWYNARLRPIRELLRERGYEVIIFESDFDHIRKRAIQKRYSECTYIHVPEYTSNISIKRIKSHLSFAKSVRKEIEKVKPDLIICQVPPNSVAKYCMNYKLSHPEIKYIIDIIDLWPESMPLGKWKSTLLARMWKNWRDRAITSADYVFTECNLYRGKLRNVLIPEKTSPLFLFKEQTEAEKELVQEIIDKRNRERLEDDKTVRFAFLGSMNNIIDIDGICNVIRHFLGKGNACDLYAIGNGESRNRFEEAVRATGCRTHFFGAVFDEIKKIKILAACDYAFNVMKDNICVGLTIKSIDYLSYGLPLINNIKGDTWKLVEKYRIGMNIDSKHLLMEEEIDRTKVIIVFEKIFLKENFVKTVGEVL